MKIKWCTCFGASVSTDAIVTAYMGVGVRKGRKELLLLQVMLKIKFYAYGASRSIVAILPPLPIQRNIVKGTFFSFKIISR